MYQKGGEKSIKDMKTQSGCRSWHNSSRAVRGGRETLREKGGVWGEKGLAKKKFISGEREYLRYLIT